MIFVWGLAGNPSQWDQLIKNCYISNGGKGEERITVSSGGGIWDEEKAARGCSKQFSLGGITTI